MFPDSYNFDERDRFYKDVSFSGWGGSSGHDAPMIACVFLWIWGVVGWEGGGGGEGDSGRGIGQGGKEVGQSVLLYVYDSTEMLLK